MYNEDKISQLSQEDQTTIKEIVAGFIEAVKPVAIWLFGSAVRNELCENSDYDFYIILDDKTTEKIFNILYKARISIKHWRRDCDILAAKESRFNQRKNNFKTLEYYVYRDGVKVYG